MLHLNALPLHKRIRNMTSYHMVFSPSNSQKNVIPFPAQAQRSQKEDSIGNPKSSISLLECLQLE